MTNELEQAPPSRLIDLSADRARAALLKSESYFDFELPKYFAFGPMLEAVSAKLSQTGLKGLQDQPPQELEKVNHTILHNKDGRLAWRPEELIHPFVYVEMVHQLTEPENWALIQSRFADFASDDRIECNSHSMISNSEQSDKAAQILQWWEDNELGSLELSLDYEYVLMTDVSDCYGSMYTHAIAWALHEKNHAQSKVGKKDKSLIGNQLDSLIRSTHRNQTNGIPQGSNLSNFLAEMVLGYGDKLIRKAITAAGLNDFKILRYRDDDRIFSKSEHDCQVIARIIGDVLRDFGMKLNPSKTSITDGLIEAAVKEDKRYWLMAQRRPTSLIKGLMVIHDLAKQHPNSGSLMRALMDFQKKIVKLDSTREQVGPMVAIVTDIAVKNPRIFPIYASILSKLFSFLRYQDKEGLIHRIRAKFKSVPHAGQLDLWLQRFLVPSGFSTDYSEPLTRAVVEPHFELWNSDWLPNSARQLLVAGQYVDQAALVDLEAVVGTDEVELFPY